MTVRRPRLAVVAQNPVQYHSGIYRDLARRTEVETTVFYTDAVGTRPTYDAEFGAVVKWDVDLLSGYKHRFVRNYWTNPYTPFFGRTNPSLFWHLRKYDLVLINGYTWFSDWITLASALIWRKRILFRGEGTLRPDSSEDSWHNRVKRWAIRRFTKNAHAVFYSCSGNRAYFLHYGVKEDRLFPLPCAVDNDFFRTAQEECRNRREEIRKDLGMSQQTFLVLSSGRLNSNKRPFDLLSAVRKTGREDIGVLFVGDGPEKEALMTMARQDGMHAVFPGFVNQSEISKYYCAADLFAMISAYDNSPKALNEAMNFSLPVICSSTVGTAHDLVEEGKNGFLVSAGDVETISSRIAFLAENSGIAKEMGCRSAEIVGRFTFKADVDSLVRAIVKVVCPA